MSRTPSPAEVILGAIEQALAELHVGLPARVERYDAAKQLVDATPLLKDFAFDEDGARQVFSMPVVTNVPVLFQGGGGFFLTFPLERGDVVYLAFADRSLDRWLDNGGEVDPGDVRRHALSDAVALPALHPFNRARKGAKSDRVVLGREGGPTIEVTTSDVVLNGGTARVAREGDSVGAGGTPLTGMLGWMTKVTTAVNLLVPSSVPDVPTTIGTISSGADHVKA